MSIKWKINLVLLIVGTITSLFVAAFSYYEAKSRIIEEAYREAEIIASFAMASRTYTVETMRPLAREIAG